MSHYAEEHYTVYNETGVRARKEHTCSACHEPIRPGDLYTRVAIIFEGSVEALKRCARCQAIHEHLRELSLEHRDGEMWPDERLNCGQDYAEEWGGEPPPEIAALAFLLPGEPLPEATPKVPPAPPPPHGGFRTDDGTGF